MKLIIGIGGEPATGKTELIRYFLDNTFKPFKYKLVHFLISAEKKMIIIGKYGENVIFLGTDKLSMAVQPHFIEFLKIIDIDFKYDNYCVIFEGDRLFNGKLILEINTKYPCLFVILKAEEHIKKLRHKLRKDKQGGCWLKSRISKYKNILKNFGFVYIWSNNNYDEQRINIEKLKKRIDGYR